MSRRVWLLAVGTGDVEHLLASLAVLEPALDHLNPLERSAAGIAHGHHQEARSGIAARDQIGAHRHAALVGRGHRAGIARETVGEVVAGEEPNPQPRPTGGEGLLAAQGVVDRLARVLLGPDAGETRSTPQVV